MAKVFAGGHIGVYSVRMLNRSLKQTTKTDKCKYVGAAETAIWARGEGPSHADTREESNKSNKASRADGRARV